MAYRTVLLVAAFSIITQACADKQESREIANNHFAENWESLSNYEIPQWFEDAKFGIFIHWGPYAVPAFGSEWYPRLMYMDTEIYNATNETQSEGPSAAYLHHKEKWGDQKEFGYKDFIPMFKAENFDAKTWIDLFKKAGARYVVPVAEHHDGFAMYNSKVTKWNSANMGPKRDVLGELFEEGRKQGLHMGASSHFAFNWAYYNKEEHFDNTDPDYADLYGKKGTDPEEAMTEEFKELWWARTRDIIDNYEPEVLWMDFYLDQEAFKEYHPKLAAYYYNKGIEWGKEVVLQDKNHKYLAFPEGTIVYDLERGKMAKINKLPWQTDTSIGENSWCYVENWKSKSLNSLIDDLIDIVSKKGCLLLNVGPKADGTIPRDQVAILEGIGKWLEINGEAIYGSRAWKTFGEGPTVSEEGYMSERKKKDSFVAEDIRFTSKNGKLYAIGLDWPANNLMQIKSLGSNTNYCHWDVKNLRLLGSDQDIKWEQTDDMLSIQLPEGMAQEFAYTIEIDFGKNSEVATASASL